MSDVQSVYLVKGDDGSLVSQAVSELLEELIGDRPLDLTLEEVNEEEDLTVVVDAASTPAFLTDRRVVVTRNIGRFRADEVDPLIAYLANPNPTTVLVLVAGGGAIPQRLNKAIKDHGHVLDVSVPTGKARSGWFADQVKRAPVKLDRRASELLADRVGDDVGQLAGIFDALAAAYGEAASITADEIEPYLGAGGSATPWQLTDAIDSGDTEAALISLRRMLEGGQRHPLVVMSTLSRHVGALLQLDGADVTSESQAASLLGMAPFPAKKAMLQAKRLGSANIARAVELVAEADVDLRGGSAWPNEVVLEVLVARLSKLVPSTRRNERPSSRSRAAS